jgi:hypothetical protein
MRPSAHLGINLGSSNATDPLKAHFKNKKWNILWCIDLLLGNDYELSSSETAVGK